MDNLDCCKERAVQLAGTKELICKGNYDLPKSNLPDLARLWAVVE